MRWASRAISIWTVSLAACGGELRAKPQLECEPSDDLPGIVCSDGLIGSCVRGVPRISICGDTTVCEANWQEPGAYKCGPDDALGHSGTTIYARGEPVPSLEAAMVRVVEGEIAPGGLAALSLSIRNLGPATAEAVSGSLTTTTPGIAIAKGSALHFGNIDSGATACGSIALSFAGDCDQTHEVPQLTVAADVALDTTVQLDLTVSDAEANTVALSFPVTVKSK